MRQYGPTLGLSPKTRGCDEIFTAVEPVGRAEPCEARQNNRREPSSTYAVHGTQYMGKRIGPTRPGSVCFSTFGLRFARSGQSKHESDIIEDLLKIRLGLVINPKAIHGS